MPAALDLHALRAGAGLIAALAACCQSMALMQVAKRAKTKGLSKLAASLDEIVITATHHKSICSHLSPLICCARMVM